MRFRIDHGIDNNSPIGYLEIHYPQIVERLKHVALVPCLVKQDDGDYKVDHFDMIPREQVDTRPLQELIGEVDPMSAGAHHSTRGTL